MARSHGSKSGASKVRLIVFEAEISDGDLSQVTQVLQNAFKSSSPAPRIIQVNPAAGSLGNPVDEDIIEGVDEVGLESPAPKPKAPRKAKVAKTPTVMDDLDFNSDPSLKDFVSNFEITTAVDKYLVIALWFRDARNIPTITVDHVYTAFRMLGWSTASNDFSKPLRNLRDEQSLKGGSKEGWTLTLPGAGKIEAKKRTS